MAKRRKRKRITKDLIRAYFGDDASISWFGCPWRVKTLSGGEVVISQREIKVIFGTEDVHRAITLLVGECWGTGVSRGSNEFMLASVMHGEAAGVPIRADHGSKYAGLVRALVFGFILFVGGAKGAWLPALLLATAVVAVLAHSDKREKQKKHEQLGFPYPRVYGSAGPARREDARRRGWL